MSDIGSKLNGPILGLAPTPRGKDTFGPLEEAGPGWGWPFCGDCRIRHPYGALADRFPAQALDLIPPYCPEETRLLVLIAKREGVAT